MKKYFINHKALYKLKLQYLWQAINPITKVWDIMSTGDAQAFLPLRPRKLIDTVFHVSISNNRIAHYFVIFEDFLSLFVISFLFINIFFTYKKKK